MATFGSTTNSTTLRDRVTKLLSGFNKFISSMEGVIDDAEIAKKSSDERIIAEQQENKQLESFIEEQSFLLGNFKNLLNK